MTAAGPPGWYDAAAIDAALPALAAVDALEAAFAAGVPPVPQRLHVPVPPDGPLAPGGELLAMPAGAEGWAVTKVVGLAPANPALGLPRVTGVVVLLGPPGLRPVGILDAAALTAIRTAAVSGVATRRLARPDTRRVVILGAGVQAEAHGRVHAALFPSARITVVARRPDAGRALVDRLVRAGITAAQVGGPDAVGTADVICCCTTGSSVVLRGDDLPPGVHVNAVGAHRPDLRELDGPAVAASAVVVEQRDAALAEKGDLLLAEEEGLWHRDRIRADLTEVCAGRVPGRRSADERTLLASVGHAFEDLVVAREVVRRAAG